MRVLSVQLDILKAVLANESIPNRSGFVLASGTLHPVTSNRATQHYSGDQMSLGKINVVFISIGSGAINTCITPLLCE